MIKCDECNGRGHKQGDVQIQCFPCRGSGWIEGPETEPEIEGVVTDLAYIEKNSETEVDKSEIAEEIEPMLEAMAQISRGEYDDGSTDSARQLDSVSGSEPASKSNKPKKHSARSKVRARTK